jgi:hypothetical protein
MKPENWAEIFKAIEKEQDEYFEFLKNHTVSVKQADVGSIPLSISKFEIIDENSELERDIINNEAFSGSDLVPIELDSVPLSCTHKNIKKVKGFMEYTEYLVCTDCKAEVVHTSGDMSDWGW